MLSPAAWCYDADETDLRHHRARQRTDAGLGLDILPARDPGGTDGARARRIAGLVFGAFSAALVVAAVLGPLAGRRIDLFGGRDVLALSSLVFAAGLATLGLAQGAGVLFAGWLVIGIGMAMGL